MDFSLTDYLKDSSRGNAGFVSTDAIHSATVESSHNTHSKTQTESENEIPIVQKKHDDIDDYENIVL